MRSTTFTSYCPVRAAAARKLSTVTSKCRMAGFDRSVVSRGVELEMTHSLVSGDTYGAGLVDRADGQGEGRREERVLRLVRRQVGQGGALAPHHPCDLRAGAVDEAGLPDAAGEQGLEVAEAAVDLVHQLEVTADLGDPVARQLVEVGEGRVVGSQQRQGPGAREVVREDVGLLLGGVRQAGVERRAGLAALPHGRAHSGGQQAQRHQECARREPT